MIDLLKSVPAAAYAALAASITTAFVALIGVTKFSIMRY